MPGAMTRVGKGVEKEKGTPTEEVHQHPLYVAGTRERGGLVEEREKKPQRLEEREAGSQTAILYGTYRERVGKKVDPTLKNRPGKSFTERRLRKKS